MVTNHSNELHEGFKMTELGSLPKEWEVVSLRGVFREIDVRVAKFQDPNAYRIPVLSLTKNYGLMLQSERFGKRIALDDVSDYKVVKRGEIVYNPYVIWEGAIHILDKFDYGLVSPVYPVLETNPERADAYFLDWTLRTPLAITAYNRFAAGAVNRRRSIRKTDFMEIRVPLPPPSEQRAIAHVFSTVQRAIEAQDKLIATALELKRSLMHHLFTYGPVPLSQAGQVPLKDTEIGPIPEHWDVAKLGEKIDFTTKPRNLDVTRHTVVTFIAMEDISSEGVYHHNYRLKPSAAISSGIFCEPGDILLAKITPCLENGKQCIVRDDLPSPFAYATTEVYPIKPKQDILDRHFLFSFLLHSPIRLGLAAKMEGTTGRQRLPKHVIRSLSFPLPPFPEQQQIASVLSTVDKKIEAEQNRKAALQTLFQTMLHLLLTGKVRVKDLEVPA